MLFSRWRSQIKLPKDEPIIRTMHIEGMMCGHCEAMVKRVLEAIDGVVEATASHTAGTAIVRMSTSVEDDLLRQAVEDEDYTVLSIE